MPGPLALLALLAIVVLAYLGWRAPASAAERVGRWWDGRSSPVVIGVVTMLALGWVGGGGLQMTPISTDENAYLLEAQLLAHGHVAGAPAPIPEFFEQPWVVVTPRTFAKYPPGQSLTLAPGVALGLPWLMPALLLVVTGALVFTLARRLVGTAGSLLAWTGWVLAPITMEWQSSYFSEVTSAAAWLIAAWAGLRWHDQGKRRWLLVAAAALAWAALTRPFTALLLGLPLGAALLPTIVRRRAWGDAAWASLVVAGFLTVLPFWNHATTGQWGESPLALYTRTYLPWDRLGFAIDSTPPLRAPSADFAPIAHHLVVVHHDHTLAALPHTLAVRAGWVLRQTFSGWRLFLLPLVLVGLTEIGVLGWIAVVSGVLLFLGHAVWGHEAGWTLYYAEATPVWFVLSGAGLAAIVRRAGGETGRARLALMVTLILPALAARSLLEAQGYRGWRAGRVADTKNFTDLVGREPGKSIWFIREPTDSGARAVLIANDPDWDSAAAWIVHDLGPRNVELQRLAPDRSAWLVDRTTGAVSPLGVPPR